MIVFRIASNKRSQYPRRRVTAGGSQAPGNPGILRPGASTTSKGRPARRRRQRAAGSRDILGDVHGNRSRSFTLTHQVGLFLRWPKGRYTWIVLRSIS